ncbi:MAG: tyrosine-type recombinase/integrase [Methanomicrobia archaeon]|nr:tyrosine-type recombinase/integrase [Methanomicrobia archaeon]
MGDIHGHQRRLELAFHRLERALITEEDRALIKDFVHYKTAAQSIGLLRQDKYLRSLMLIAERYLDGRTYASLTREDVMEIVSNIERSGMSGWTKHDYRVILKAFMIWLGKEKEVVWIKTSKPRKLPDEILNEGEISRLIDSARSLRDKAFVACLYEGGFRISEIGGLRMKDVDFDRYGAIAMVEGKTGMRRVRLIWSTPYLSQWLEAHPQREDRLAPVWIKKDGKALGYPALREQLREIAKRAGIKKKVNPHNFRHSRSTHLASRLTESQMEEYLGWVQGSRMPSIYVHMSGRDLDGDLLKMYGLEDKRDDEPIKLKMQECPHCRTVNTAGARICINCRKPLAVDEVLDLEARSKEFLLDMMDSLAKNPEKVAQFKAFFKTE